MHKVVNKTKSNQKNQMKMMMMIKKEQVKVSIKMKAKIHKTLIRPFLTKIKINRKFLINNLL